MIFIYVGTIFPHYYILANLQINQFTDILDFWKISYRRYHDFFISKDIHALNRKIDDDCIVVTIDTNDEACIGEDGETLYSKSIWKDAVNTGIELPDWGLCSIDNGYTPWDKSTQSLLDVFMNTKLVIEEDDKRFFMKPVHGYYYDNPPIDYSISIDESDGDKYINADGGFYQGFYKLFFPTYNKNKYQTVYNRAECSEFYEFVIRPRNIVKENTLNYYFPENAGFFFYKGTRAENKWWYYSNRINLENLEHLKQELLKNNITYLDDCLDPVKLNEIKSIYENIMTSDRVLLNTPNFTEFETDNKYLYFNRTCCGFTIHDDYPEKVLIGYQEKNNDLNYYLLFNRTMRPKKGLMISDIHPTSNCCTYSYWYWRKKFQCDPYLQYNVIDKKLQNFPEELKNIDIYDNKINIFGDVYNNAIGFRLTPEGKIGYRFIQQNCGEDKDTNPTKILEEYSSPNIINWDVWNHIIVKINYDQCIKNPECSTAPSRTGEIAFYVNGKLKFASKNFMEPVFHELKEYWQKQEGVPYNISLMGGSQGLLETILSDCANDYDRYAFPIEQHFAGTLMGDCKLFRIGNCNINLNQIRNQYTILVKNVI